MNLTKNTIALIAIGTVSTAALILSIIAVSHTGYRHDRGEGFSMMRNNMMMQGNAQQRGNFQQKAFTRGTGDTQLPDQSIQQPAQQPTQQQPVQQQPQPTAETPAE